MSASILLTSQQGLATLSLKMGSCDHGGDKPSGTQDQTSNNP